MHTKFSKRGFEEKIWMISHNVRNHFADWDLGGKIPSVALRETGFEYQDESYKKLVFGYFSQSISHCKEPKAKKYFFKSRKKSIDTLMDEMQPVVLEN